MALLLAVLTTAVRADVVPFTESYNAESTTDGWTSSVTGRFTPKIYDEDGNYYLSVDQNQRSSGAVVTGTVLAGKAAAGDDFTLEFDMKLGNTNNNSGSQSPIVLKIKDADNTQDILSLSAPNRYVPVWNVNGTDLQVTLPFYGGQTLTSVAWCHYKISRSGSLTYLTITNNATQTPILDRTLIEGGSETGGLGNITFTTLRYYANFAIDNIELRALQEGDVPYVETTSYTIRYRNEAGEEIKEDIVKPSVVGGEATANSKYVAPVYYNDKKYLYKEGNNTITLVGDAAQNVITLVYREAQKCTYTVKAIYGDKEKVLIEETGFEQDEVTYNYPKYILDGTALYLKKEKSSNPYFGNTIILDGLDVTEYVEYTDGIASDVVYYKEAEQIEGFTPLATNNADIRCSDGKGGVIEGDEPVVLTTLPAGTYIIYGQVWGTAGYTATITAGDKTVWELTSPGWLADATSEELTLTEETTLYIKDSGDLEGKKMLDLIYIQEAKPHYIAEFNRDEATLTFRQGALPLGSTIVWDAENTGSQPGWYSQRTNVKTVIFDESFADARPTSCAQWFKGATTLTTITGLEYLNTSEVTSMAEMFRNTQQLTTLDLSTFDTKNVTDMNYMFYNDYRLTSLNVSSFNTSKVENMSYMFGYCSALTELDVSNFNTSNVTDMSGMFYECSSLTSLDLGNFNTSNVTNTSWMFGGCSSLKSLDVSNFNTSKVTDMGGMFFSCGSLNSLGVSSFNTSNVMNMRSMFYACISFTSLDISNFNTANVTNMSSMFSYCRSLKTIYVGEGWTTAAVTESSNMFAENSELVGGSGTICGGWYTDAEYARIDGGADAPGYFTDKNATPYVKPEAYAVLSEDGQTVTFYYDAQKANRTGVVELNRSFIDIRKEVNAYGSVTTAVIDASFADYRPTSTAYWFMECPKLTSISGMENLNTSNVTDMCAMFYGCSSLTSLDVSNFNTSKVTDMSCMFYECSSLTSLDVSNFNTSNVRGMGSMFNGCSSLTSLDISKFNTSNVTGMYGVFEGCSSLALLDVNNFNTSNVTNMGRMFSGCSSLTSLDVSNFNTSNVTSMSGMFYGCSSLTSLDVSNFNTTNVTSMSFMFEGCSSLTSLDVSKFNTDNVEMMNCMFYGCSSLISLDVSKFNTSNVTYMNSMFFGCSSLTSLDVSNFNTDKVTDMSWMFSGCNSLSSLDLSNFNTSNVTRMASMFSDCSSLKTINVGEGWNASAVTNSGYMFSDCTALVGGAGTVYDANHIDAEYARIDGEADAPGYFTAKNDTPKDNVTLTAKSYSREYGEANPAFEYDVTEGTITNGTPELSSGATAASPVGTYDIVISKGSVTNNEVSLVNGTLTITKAPLTISCGDYTIMQGEALPYFAPMYDGWKNGETEKVLTKRPTVWCVARQDSEPGTYDIIVRDAEAENYEISYVAGTLTITAKPIVIESVEVETEMKTEALNGQDLSNNVVNDVYYNTGEGSYDASDKSVVISQTTNFAQIADKEPGSKDVKENFNGMILKVAKGKGLITVNVKTSGNAQLVVQVGNGTPMLASKTEKGDVVFRYDVEEDTYVYIYAIIGSSAAKGYGINAADTESSVRIYGITVSPGATGIRSIGASERNDGNIYDLQGHRVETPAKGIYIIGGRKVAVK